MGDSGITYAPKAWNFISGCRPDFECWGRCWARRMAHRMNGRHGYPEGKDAFKPTMHPDKLNYPATVKQPSMFAVDFMGDLFVGDFPWDYIDQAFQIMEENDHHTYLILTKRPEIARDYIGHWLDDACWQISGCPIYSPGEKLRSHMRIGTSILHQEDADTRLPVLCEINAEFLWVSYEPAIGPVKFGKIGKGRWPHDPPGPPECGMFNPLTGHRWALQMGRPGKRYWDGAVNTIRQVVMGCESGPGRREMNWDWARSVRDECVSARVGFYFKQAYVDGKLVERPELDGQVWDQVDKGV